MLKDAKTHLINIQNTKNNHFTIFYVNRFIKVMSQQIPNLSHWHQYQLDPNKMTEQLVYDREPSRHQDADDLMKPNMDNPSNGFAGLFHNLVNGEIKSDGSIKRFNDKPKYFCINSM